MTAPLSEGVVLLHGIIRTRRSMAGLGRFLEAAGYETCNIGYPSRRHSLEQLIKGLHAEISDFSARVGALHFVGYSMGGLLARAYVQAYRPAGLGRMVLLGTPNSGSEVADFLRGWRSYRWLYGPAGQQLITGGGNAALLGTVDYPLGVIAGCWSWDPVCSRLIGPQPNDGKVSVASTRVDGMAAHKVLPVSHTFMPHRRQVWRETLVFLQSGAFSASNQQQSHAGS